MSHKKRIKKDERLLEKIANIFTLGKAYLIPFLPTMKEPPPEEKQMVVVVGFHHWFQNAPAPAIVLAEVSYEEFYQVLHIEVKFLLDDGQVDTKHFKFESLDALTEYASKLDALIPCEMKYTG